MNRPFSEHPACLVGVLLVAIAARGAALWRYGEQLRNDPDAYVAIAETIASWSAYDIRRWGFGFPVEYQEGLPSAYRPPLYPVLLTPLVAASSDATALARAIGAVHLALGTATVLLVVLIGRRLGLEGASLIAGLIAAVDPLLVYNTALVMTETTATFLVALLFWISLRATTDGERCGVGLVFGLCCLCRPTFWAFGALVAAGWLVFHLREAWRRTTAATGHRPSFWGAGLVVAAGTFLAVAPWVSRNKFEMGEPILTTTHGGYTLLLAHNPRYTSEVVNQPWGAVWQIRDDPEWIDWLLAEMRGQTPEIDNPALKAPDVEIARDRWMNRRAWQYIRDDPQTALRAGLTLLGRFWNVIPLSTADRPITGTVKWGLGTFYVLEFAAMFVGLCRLRRDEWLQWWPYLALILSLTAVHSLYWADMRMRAPLVPAIALFAARAFVRETGR